MRGPVEITPDPTSALIDELCRKYHGRPWQREPDHVHRVVVRVRPERVVVYDD